MLHWGQNIEQFMLPADGFLPVWLLILIPVIVAWSLVWKAFALWRAARNGSKIWFAVLLVVNTAGILEILYYFIFSKKAPPSA